jgi:hypothetical protein
VLKNRPQCPLPGLRKLVGPHSVAMPRLTNICVFLACGLMLYSATYLSNPSPRRQAQPSVQPGEAPAASDGELARVRQQLDEAQRREERTRELLRVTQEQASRTGTAPVAAAMAAPVAAAAVTSTAARQVNAGIVLDGTLDASLKLAAPTGPGFLMLTFSNSALKDHLYNFVAHAKEVAAPHVVGAVDVETFDLLREITAVYKTPLAAANFQMDGSNQHSSGSWKKFAMMRTGEVARLVGLGYSVLHTDIDVTHTGLSNPRLAGRLPAARVLLLTRERLTLHWTGHLAARPQPVPHVQRGGGTRRVLRRLALAVCRDPTGRRRGLLGQHEPGARHRGPRRILGGGHLQHGHALHPSQRAGAGGAQPATPQPAHIYTSQAAALCNRGCNPTCPTLQPRRVSHPATPPRVPPCNPTACPRPSRPRGTRTSPSPHAAAASTATPPISKSSTI